MPSSFFCDFSEYGEMFRNVLKSKSAPFYKRCKESFLESVPVDNMSQWFHNAEFLYQIMENIAGKLYKTLFPENALLCKSEKKRRKVIICVICIRQTNICML